MADTEDPASADGAALRAGPTRGDGAGEHAKPSRGEQTRRAILEATLRLIAGGGLHAVSFREVAAEADVSLGVTTYHFPKRETLVEAAFALHLERQDARGVALRERHAERWPDPATIGTQELGEAVIELLASRVHSEREAFLTSQELALVATRDTRLARTLDPARKTEREAIAALLAHTGSEDATLDAELLSLFFDALALAWIHHPDDRGFDEHVGRAVHRLLGRFVDGPGA